MILVEHFYLQIASINTELHQRHPNLSRLCN